LRAVPSAPSSGGPPVLAIESSCDETAAAVLTGTHELRSNVVHSQIPLHARFGGVVPELASRAHVMAIDDVVGRALTEAGVNVQDLCGIAVTQGPGLSGSLLVGLEYAKGLGMAANLPVVGVHHLHGHAVAARLGQVAGTVELSWPCVVLLVSGGHTSLVLARSADDYEELGRTLDDAAGEAYDKVSKQLGLGYPGGAVLDELAATGDPRRWQFPRSMLQHAGLTFSFSGLKTAVAYHLRDHGVPEGQDLRDLASSFQQAVVDVLWGKLARAAQQTGVEHVVISGGVACNRGLRSRALSESVAAGLRLTIPPPWLCTDNAAMIGAAGYERVWRSWGAGGEFDSHGLDALTQWRLGGFGA
jgi:N6-L-threonylcarbamoyladenine synthase